MKTIQHAFLLCQPNFPVELRLLLQPQSRRVLAIAPTAPARCLVEPMGFEPTTPALPAQCSPIELRSRGINGVNIAYYTEV